MKPTVVNIFVKGAPPSSPPDIDGCRRIRRIIVTLNAMQQYMVTEKAKLKLQNL